MTNLGFRFKFDILRTAEDSPFLAPARVLIKMTTISRLNEQGNVIDSIPLYRPLTITFANPLAMQIAEETGIEHVKILEYRIDDSDFMVKLPNPESFLLFKLKYYGGQH